MSLEEAGFEPGVPSLIKSAYAAFNTRDVDRALSLMKPNVVWPNGVEGGYVHGPAEVRAYWLRQWEQLDPHVEPRRFVAEADGRVRVEVHQVVKDKAGTTLADKTVYHIYRIEAGRICSMEIEPQCG